MLNKEFAYKETFISGAPINKYNIKTGSQLNLAIETSMHNDTQDNMISFL